MKHLGATVIGTVGSDEKAELAKQHGCDYPVVYTREYFVDRVGCLILKEVVLPSTWFFAALTTAGVGVMVVEGLQLGTLFGTAMGLCAATGFALFAVQLRQGRQTDLVPFVLWARFFASLCRPVQ